jgi:hypothetical protein
MRDLQWPKRGERYNWNGDRVTVSMVDEDEHVAQLRVYDPSTGATQFLYRGLPLPPEFVWAGTGEVQICERCVTKPVELGMAYCPDCVDILALTYGAEGTGGGK